MKNNHAFSCPPPPGTGSVRDKAAFTLAEVLIVLAIIGVIAAIVLPSFVNNFQARIKAEQNRTIQYKLTKATDQMKSLGLIGNYKNTEAFINTLKKHLKITQVCKNDNLENCWPTKIITAADGTEIEIKNLKTGNNFNPVGYTKNNIGIITADGTPIIMSFKDDCESLDPEKTYTWTTEDNKPVTNQTTSCIAMIYDLNGKKRPNKSGEDVRLFNVSSLNNGFECITVNGVCVMVSDVSPLGLSKAECELNKDILGIDECYYDTDYWAGAKKACYDAGGRLPTSAELAKIASNVFKANISTTQNYNGPIDPNNVLGLYGVALWSGDNYTGYEGRIRGFYPTVSHYRTLNRKDTSAYGSLRTRCVRR